MSCRLNPWSQQVSTSTCYRENQESDSGLNSHMPSPDPWGDWSAAMPEVSASSAAYPPLDYHGGAVTMPGSLHGSLDALEDSSVDEISVSPARTIPHQLASTPSGMDSTW